MMVIITQIRSCHPEPVQYYSNTVLGEPFHTGKRLVLVLVQVLVLVLIQCCLCIILKDHPLDIIWLPLLCVGRAVFTVKIKWIQYWTSITPGCETDVTVTIHTKKNPSKAQQVCTCVLGEGIADKLRGCSSI